MGWPLSASTAAPRRADVYNHQFRDNKSKPEKGRAAIMEDVATYAPIRIVLTGVWRVAFGGLFLLLAAVTVFAFLHAPRSSADPPLWLLALIPVFFSLIGAAAVSSGMGRILSAFARNCYLRGGPDGIAVRMPVRGWFGRFRVMTFKFEWSEIDKLIEFTHRINGIPSSHELRIRLRNGRRLDIERCYFSVSSAAIQGLLLAHAARR
jgi:hypothetical protein